MTKKVAVVLSGCGVYDGAEIYESVLTLLALQNAGAEVSVFAPDMAQHHVINHLNGEEMAESRNVLVEAARLVRGEIQDVKQARVEEFDALIVPGGFGAAKNLSNFALVGADFDVQPDFLAFSQAMHKASKPIGLICIAPAMAAAICGAGVECTIGDDSDTAAAVEASGARHVNCKVDNVHVDQAKRLVTTPAYMLAENIAQANAGISKLVEQVLLLS